MREQMLDALELEAVFMLELHVDSILESSRHLRVLFKPSFLWDLRC